MEKKKYTYEPFATPQPLRGTAESGMHPNLSTDNKITAKELNQHELAHPAVVKRASDEAGINLNVWTADEAMMEDVVTTDRLRNLYTSPTSMRIIADRLRFKDTEAHFSIEELKEISEKLGGIASQLASVPWHKRLGSEYRETKATLGRERADLKLDETYIGNRLDRITAHGSLPEMEERLLDGPRAGELYDYALETAEKEGVEIETSTK